MLNKNACALYIKYLRKLGPGVTYVTSDTSEQIKAGTELARVLEVCVLLNLGPVESWPTSPGF